MTVSATARFNPADHGLFRAVHNGTEIIHAVWQRTCAEGGFVGSCRRCGGFLAPQRPQERTPGVFDYEAACTAGHTVCAPGGRILPRPRVKTDS